MKKLVLILVSLLALFVGFYLFLSQKNSINFKKLIFPWKYIQAYEKEAIEVRRDELIRDELDIKENLTNLHFYKIEKEQLLSKKLSLVKFMGDSKLMVGIYRLTPGSFYLSNNDKSIYLTSSIGITAYGTIDEHTITLKQIKNNLGEFINLKQFRKAGLSNKFSIKDSQIIDKKIYITLTKEVEKDCWNITLLSSNLNNNYLNFEEVFSPKQCVNSKKDIIAFNSHSSGGRTTDLDEDHVLLSIGDFGYLDLPQDKNSIFGKVLKVNKFKKNNYEIISMGHRNPQGLYYDKKENLIIETEHGPFGGDEINLIDPFKRYQNFGWPIASYGEHYGYPDDIERIKPLYKKYPLLKSHSNNNFIEPLKYFVPSIAISQITKIDDLTYALASLKQKSLYIVKLNKKNEISNIQEFKVKERIRDIIFFQGSLYLSLEDTASIGYIDISN